MNDQQLTHLSALTTLNNMLKARHFDICVIDSVIKILGTVPDSRAYNILRPLHCVNYMDMPRELRDELPSLIERCIEEPAHQFQITQVKNPDMLRGVDCRHMKQISEASNKLPEPPPMDLVGAAITLLRRVLESTRR